MPFMLFEMQEDARIIRMEDLCGGRSAFPVADWRVGKA